jgi:formylglycine-generating enzyme required for sulfatase activity
MTSLFVPRYVVMIQLLRIVLIGLSYGIVCLGCKKAPEGISTEAIQFDPQSVKAMTNSIGMKLVWIPPGEFQMGLKEYEEPVHPVKLTKGFWIGQFEVTQDQYQSVMGTNPSEYKGGNLPIERISWNDAGEFCRKLEFKEGKTYRLPTEAEWEYACRAGTATKYSFGDSADMLWQYGNYCDASNTSNYSSYTKDTRHNDRYAKTSPVGSFKPNPWGLYDMHGNVWECCSDWYKVGYDSGMAINPTGPQEGKTRVLRGGCWDSAAKYCRSSARGWAVDPTEKSYKIGFRVILESD